MTREKISRTILVLTTTTDDKKQKLLNFVMIPVEEQMNSRLEHFNQKHVLHPDFLAVNGIVIKR
jgi:hypothetical protein